VTQRASSRIAGFYRHPLPERVRLIAERAGLSDDALALLRRGGGLSTEVADRMSENVIACHGLPLSLALNFRVNGRDYLIPMAIEEPSVVAAASNAARLVRMAGGFTADADPPVMTAQIQLDGVSDAAGAPQRLAARAAELLALGDAAIPGMVERGGGCRDLEARVIDAAEGMVVVHVYLDVGDAMGANTVDTVAEAMAPAVADCVGGSVGLRILTNLTLRRRVRARAVVSAEAVGGEGLAAGVARASLFAERDPLRATTHNKGIMNGIDAAAVALGQDWRSLEAGAHAFAAQTGCYRPLATWHHRAGQLEGRLEMPMAVGIVGGATRAHPGVRAAFEILQVDSARELACVLAAAGLASNLAALKALAGEGIQRGHMRLHNRRLAEAAGSGS
jgi:hydroxymethylglutaryl-CoA reductase